MAVGDMDYGATAHGLPRSEEHMETWESDEHTNTHEGHIMPPTESRIKTWACHEHNKDRNTKHNHTRSKVSKTAKRLHRYNIVGYAKSHITKTSAQGTSQYQHL